MPKLQASKIQMVQVDTPAIKGLKPVGNKMTHLTQINRSALTNLNENKTFKQIERVGKALNMSTNERP